MNIGLISYLNAIPINFFLDKILNKGLDQFKLFYSSPNILAQNYKNSSLYASFIPLFDFLHSPFYSNTYVYDQIGISSQKSVQSVLLFYNKDIKKVKKIGVDLHSLSSQYLLKILIKSFFKLECQFFHFDPKDTETKTSLDAYLIIGDNAILERKIKKNYLDLAEIWFNWTNLPFTFCIFLSYEKNPFLKKSLIESKDLGLSKIKKIIHTMPYPKKKFLYHYYTNNLCFNIHKEAIALYQNLLFENKFIDFKNKINYF